MLKNFSVYFLTSIIYKVIPFVLLPILTHYLRPSDFGYVSLLQVLIAFLYPIQNLNGNLYLSKEFFTVDQNEIKFLNGNHFILVSSLSLILLLFISLFFKPLNGLLNLELYWWILVILGGIFNSINLNYTTILRCSDRPFYYAFIEIAKSSSNILLSLVLVITFGMGWTGRAYGIVLTPLVFGFISLALCLKYELFSFSIDGKIWSRILKFSLPLIPYSIGSMVLNFSDRIFIERYLDISALGIYSVAYTLGMSILVFTEAFNKAWSPIFFSMVVEYRKNKVKIFKSIFLYILVIAILPFLLFVFSKYVIFPYLIDEKYYEALKYVFGIAFAYVLQGVFLIMYPFLAWMEKTKLIGLITIVSAIVNLALNYILIPRFGLYGAIYATVLTYFFMSLTVIGCVNVLLKKQNDNK